MSILKAVVLGEADEMLDLGFRDDLEFILKNTPDARRTLLFSATLPRGIVTSLACGMSGFMRSTARTALSSLVVELKSSGRSPARRSTSFDRKRVSW